MTPNVYSHMSYNVQYALSNSDGFLKNPCPKQIHAWIYEVQFSTAVVTSLLPLIIWFK
jgi:hypothetical protein